MDSIEQTDTEEQFNFKKDTESSVKSEKAD